MLPIGVKVEIGVRTAVPCIILLLTGVRLHVRGRQRWGWDDALVAFGCIWLIISTPTGIETLVRAGHNDSIGLALFYVYLISYLGMLWSARLSILQSIIRITPQTRDKKRTQLIAYFLVFLWLLEIAQSCWLCAPNPHLSDPSDKFFPACISKNQTFIIHLITTIISDGILLVLPPMILRALRKSAPRIRTRVTLAFLASLCTTILSMATTIERLSSKSFPSSGRYLGLFEAYTALIVCNIPVLVVAVFRVLGVRNFSSHYDKDLPPIAFAERPKKSSSSPMAISSWSNDDATPSNSSLKPIPCDFGSVSSSTLNPTVKPTVLHVRSVSEPRRSSIFTQLTAGVHTDEEECEEEARRIREETTSAPETGTH